MGALGSAKIWFLKQSKVLLGVLRQAVVPVAASLIWAYVKTSEQTWSWTTFIGSFMSALAIMSILASQWFRVSKQLRDQDNFGTLNQGVNGLIELAERIYAAQNRDGHPPRRKQDEQAAPRADVEPIEAAQLAQSPADYFVQANRLLQLGYGLPAMWMAAMGFERAVRDAAVAAKKPENYSLSQTVKALVPDMLSPTLAEEMMLLARLRNQLAHPIDKSNVPAASASILEPDRVVNSFQIGTFQVQDAVDRFWFDRMTAKP